MDLSHEVFRWDGSVNEVLIGSVIARLAAPWPPSRAPEARGDPVDMAKPALTGSLRLRLATTADIVVESGAEAVIARLAER
jgi:hypothetical protein